MDNIPNSNMKQDQATNSNAKPTATPNPNGGKIGIGPNRSNAITAPNPRRKMYLFPALYLILAAALTGAIWLYQHNKADEALSKTASVPTQESPIDALPVTATQDEVLHWPVADTDAIQVVTPFYSEAASPEDKAAAMMQYGDSYTPSVGISIARKDGKTFDVLAAKSGTVTRIETLPMLGNVIEVTHANKQKTVYDAIDTVSVKLNDKVSQGAVLGTAGRNELEKQHGIHVHFEVFNNDSPVNPTALLSPTLTALTGATPTTAPSASATP